MIEARIVCTHLDSKACLVMRPFLSHIFWHAIHAAITVCCSDNFFVNMRNLGINLLVIRNARTALFRQIQCESCPCIPFPFVSVQCG
jgi:hypothetical protein